MMLCCTLLYDMADESNGMTHIAHTISMHVVLWLTQCCRCLVSEEARLAAQQGHTLEAVQNIRRFYSDAAPVTPTAKPVHADALRKAPQQDFPGVQDSTVGTALRELVALMGASGSPLSLPEPVELASGLTPRDHVLDKSIRKSRRKVELQHHPARRWSQSGSRKASTLGARRPSDTRPFIAADEETGRAALTESARDLEGTSVLTKAGTLLGVKWGRFDEFTGTTEVSVASGSADATRLLGESAAEASLSTSLAQLGVKEDRLQSKFSTSIKVPTKTVTVVRRGGMEGAAQRRKQAAATRAARLAYEDDQRRRKELQFSIQSQVCA